MAIETVEKIIDNMEFHIQQFKAEDSINLEVETLGILSPGLDMLDKFKGLDSEVDLGNLGSTLQKILFSLKSENPFEYIKKMVRNTIYMEKGSPPLQLNTNEGINKVFTGKTLSLMKLLFEVMNANKFAFIEGLVGRGITITGLFETALSKEKKFKKGLEISEN